jgi:XTP/dITP diphosphohydrolase
LPRLTIATTNAGKLAEIVPMLDALGLELLTLHDFRSIPIPEETGRTFAANARAKALYYSRATGGLTVAEDSGLAIDALDGAPGVESARFGGEGSSYPEKFTRIYDALRARHALDSPARFVCAVALVEGGRTVFEAEGCVEGRIANEPKGAGGFGYDPIFFYPPFGCTFGEAAARKGEVSHRARAFQALRTFLGQQDFGARDR